MNRQKPIKRLQMWPNAKRTPISGTPVRGDRGMCEGLEKVVIEGFGANQTKRELQPDGTVREWVEWVPYPVVVAPGTLFLETDTLADGTVRERYVREYGTTLFLVWNKPVA